MERQLPRPLALGDIADVEAYVRTIVATLSLDNRDEDEELVADGLELVSRKHGELRAGASLEKALNTWLSWRLRDRLRERRPEWRRNTRAATAYALPCPTGLAWESGEAEPLSLAFDESPLVDSRLALAPFRSEAELRDPRRIGGYLGVPSAAGVATGTAREIWTVMVEERGPTAGSVPSQPDPFATPTFIL